MRVATWGEDPDFPGRSGIIRFSPLSDFRALQDKYRYTYEVKDENGNQTVTVKLGTWWIKHPQRRQYDGGMRFMPLHDEKVVGDVLNLWQGFAVETRKPEGKSGAAGCKLFLDHGLNVVCSGNEEHFAYLIKREAFIAQQRTRSEIAVGLQTEKEGTGKGIWSRTLNHLYGEHAMQVQNPEHVTGKHNRHLEKLLRFTADEALFALDPRHRNALYNLITEPRILIEPKFVDGYSADNHLNIDVISNSKHFLPVSASARRLFLPTVSAERANDHEYFRKIMVQLKDEGGYEALLYHLLHEIDIKDFNVRDVPKTAALAEQAAYSRTGVDLLVEVACNEGRVPCCRFAEWPNFTYCASYDDKEGFDYFIAHHPDKELVRLGSLAIKRRLKDDWQCVTGKEARKQFTSKHGRATFTTRVQGIAVDEGNIFQTQFGSAFATVLQKRIAAIQPNHLAFRAHSLCELDRRITKATADIEDPITLLDRQRWEDRLAVMGQPVDQNVLVLDEFRNEYLVPEIHVLGALHIFSDCAHDLSSQNYLRWLLGAAQDYGQASHAPLGKTLFQPAGLEAARAQRRDRFVREHAVRAAAISYDLLLRVDLAKAGFELA